MASLQKGTTMIKINNTFNKGTVEAGTEDIVTEVNQVLAKLMASLQKGTTIININKKDFFYLQSFMLRELNRCVMFPENSIMCYLI
jgi:hypothetical protein